jgi:phosphatidylinositol 3-kinase
VEWLDRLTLSQIQSTLGTALARNNKAFYSGLEMNQGVSSSHGQAYEELDLQSFCCLVVELPQYPYPILYEERAYSNATNLHQPPTNPESIAQGIYLDYDDAKPLEFAIGSNRPFNVNSLIVIADWDVDMDNLSEDMHRRMNHNTLRGNFDVHIKPNLKEKEMIDTILQAPANHSMAYEDMDLLYRFRHSLTDNKKALTKFLMAIDWTSESEIAELPFLLSKWKEKGPIDVADALKLLGREKCYQHPPVREYAVEVLQTASDEDLLKYLLQLVQALRYEPSVIMRKPTSAQPAEQQSTGSVQSRTVSPLARFLISRGCRSTIVANYLYWYLKVETEDETAGSMFTEVFESFMLELSSSGDAGKRAAKQLEAQDDYIAKVCQCQRDARDLGRKKNDKELALRKLLAERELQTVPTKGVKSVPLPLVPEKQISGLNPNTAAMFASAVYPCVIEFYIDNSGSEDTVAAEATAAVTSSTNSTAASISTAIATPLVSKPLTHKIMFKSGDDLRQDQLIMQMISLMDALLKRVNLDLRLLTYGILAVSHNDGIMEFVSNSMPISAILKNHSTLANYLRIHNPDDSGPYGISSIAMETFVRSCAGYAVITYILGIGDRHLDNLMMTKSGQFFHIDFGFIFGQDPKPLPPPFRLTRSMVDCMGGEDSEHYSKFKSFCYQAYNWLRKSANLILNLLSLMGDAGINDISKRSELSKVLTKVEERFRLDLTDEEAEHYFLSLINESLNSIAPKVMEIAHKIAVSMR